MDETKGAPVYGPWSTVSRPRTNTRCVNIGGTSRQQTNREPIKKKVSEWMKEILGFSQYGQTYQGDTNSDNITSQAASNNSNPVPEPATEDKANLNPEPEGSISEIRTTPNNREESSNEEPNHAYGADQTKQMDTSNMSSPTTIMFDLNSTPEEDQGDYDLSQEICDLSLKLSVPVASAQEQNSIPPEDEAESETQGDTTNAGEFRNPGGTIPHLLPCCPDVKRVL